MEAELVVMDLTDALAIVGEADGEQTKGPRREQNLGKISNISTNNQE